MKSGVFTAPYSDEAIVAWIDRQMSDDDASQFERHLETDQQLAARTEQLMQSNQPFEQAFALLLDDAPEAKLQSQLNTLLDKTAASAGPSASRRALLAASLGFLAVGMSGGAGLGYLLRGQPAKVSGSEKVRELVAQYMSLYSNETLADADSAPSVLDKGLARTQQDIGLHLDTAQLALPDSELKSVRMLRYDSTSIAQIAWANVDSGPMALCISRAYQPSAAVVTAQSEKRHGMNLVWWSAQGYLFVLVGRNPLNDLEKNAQTLQARIT
ncbi:anti-sigma factor family protein [Rouxiella sp. Mn2063]|uniref:anti-sigma factor family protein n=1 Tax=Rouxiella sp. Mn2063 TaxID=3395262 RepID=UPI003BD03AA0